MFMAQLFSYLIISAVLFVAEDPVSVCDLGGCREVFYPPDSGFYEFREDIQQGRVKIGSVAVVVCLLGGAEVRQERLIAKEFQALLQAFRTFAPDTYLLVTGPFPHPGDSQGDLTRFQEIHRAIEGRLLDEPMFRYVAIADRFGDNRGLNPRLMTTEGLTERGIFVLRRELNEAIELLVP